MAPRKKPKVDRDDHEPKVDRDDHDPKVDRDDHEPQVGDDTVTPGLDNTMTHSKRGRTNMYCLYKDRVTGVIKDVDFDKLGRPIGENGTKLQSYIGVLAREKVKITYPTWKHVPKDIKEQIWKAVTQMSDEHKELAKLNKWPHNLSRKGYARYAAENQSLLSGDNDLDRATLWLEARKKKDGEFENDELKEIASKIVGFIEKKNSGPEYEVEGGGKSVALILESGKNIVAYGTIIKVDDPLVPKNCMCVSIEKAEDKSAILPFPTGDCLTIDDAIGSHVTWPMHLMKLHDQVI
ncbi:hypothetical protein ACS0TY_019006 [Phlomoides rotata]